MRKKKIPTGIEFNFKINPLDSDMLDLYTVNAEGTYFLWAVVCVDLFLDNRDIYMRLEEEETIEFSLEELRE